MTAQEPPRRRRRARVDGASRVFLVGYFGVGNLGDDVIRDAIERAADRLGVIIVRYASRDAADPDPRAVPVRGPGLWRYGRAILEADRVVLGGGGILKDEGLALPLELWATTLAARMARRPVALLAVGVGPFYHRAGRWLVGSVARMARVRSVRDADSAHALARLGVGGAIVDADVVFSLAPVEPMPRRQHASRLRIVVSVRPWFHQPGGGRRAAADAFRCALADGLIAAGIDDAEVVLVPLYHPRDVEESASLAELLAARSRAVLTVVDERLDWEGLVDVMRSADVVIAMRYHAAVAGAFAGRPIVALAYEPKVAELAADLGIAVLDVDPVSVGERLAGILGPWLAWHRATPATGRGSAPIIPTADQARLGALRRRAWRGLARALTGRAETGTARR